jgi:hypothetical protein
MASSTRAGQWKSRCGAAIQPLRVSVGELQTTILNIVIPRERRRHNLELSKRDLPRNDCGVASMARFNVNLQEIGKLMDLKPCF